MFSAKHVRGGNVQIIDNQSILRFAPRTCRHSKADLCDRRIAKSALDNCVCTISGVVPLTSILMSGQFSHRPRQSEPLNGSAERTELTPSRLFPSARRNCSRAAKTGTSLPRDFQPAGNQLVPIRRCPAIHFLKPIAVHVTCRKQPSRALQQRFRNWVCTAIILLQLYRNMEQPQVNPKQPGTVLNGHGDGPEQHESYFGNFWTKKKPPGSNLAASIIQERDYS